MTRSHELFARANRLIPGGVNSPVRAFRSVGLNPLFIKRGQGAYLTDVDGKEYLDYVLSWGPLILGHAHEGVLEAVQKALVDGSSFGAPTLVEVELAEKVLSFFPSMQQVRFVSSGTEACMSVIRLARGFTGRQKILKFTGCYHGHADSLLVSAGSGALTFSVPSSAGIPPAIAQETLVAPFNDLEAVSALFKQYPDDIAGIIVEPVAGNMNLVLPTPEFLSGLRALCDQHGALLILDEVMTGWRVGLHGAQGYYGVRPDLTVLGKVIGGGFPAAAFGGRDDIMGKLAPLGPVYQAGTLSGNPIAMTAGLATLNLLTPAVFDSIASRTTQLVQGLIASAKKWQVSFHAQSIGSMFGLYFTEQKSILNEDDTKACNLPLFKQFFAGMLNEGIYLAPSAFEVGFLSSAHSEQDIHYTIEKSNIVFEAIS